MIIETLCKNLEAAKTELEQTENDIMQKLFQYEGADKIEVKVQYMQILAQKLEALQDLEGACRSNLSK